MRLLAALWAFVVALAKILAYQWIFALYGLLRKVYDMFERWWARRRLPGRARKASPAPCVPINEVAFPQPDPLIYAQYDPIRPHGPGLCGYLGQSRHHASQGWRSGALVAGRPGHRLRNRGTHLEQFDRRRRRRHAGDLFLSQFRSR